MDGLISFGATAGVAAIVYVTVRMLWGVRGERALFRLADRSVSSADDSRIVAELGTARPATEAGFQTRRHRASWGMKALATVIAPLLFSIVNAMLLDARGGEGADTTAQWLGTGALALLVWYLAWVWTYAVEVGQDSLSVPTFVLVRRSLPLGGLVAVEDADPHFLRLRFRDGRRAQVLRYVAGRAELERALAQHVARNGAHNGELAGGACRNYPRSKRSAEGSSPF